MTERKPPGVSFESWVERQIRVATERGDFANLPGAGKPLPGLGEPHDEMWWIKQKMDREGISAEAVLPTPLKLRKEIDQLPDVVRGLRSEQAVREVVEGLNQRIRAWLRAPSGPQVQVRLVNPENVVEQWRADRAGVDENAPSEPGDQLRAEGPPSRPIPGWRGITRLFTRRRRQAG
jgi:Domain of unknown function (DUF1992)